MRALACRWLVSQVVISANDSGSGLVRAVLIAACLGRGLIPVQRAATDRYFCPAKSEDPVKELSSDRNGSFACLDFIDEALVGLSDGGTAPLIRGERGQ